MKRLTSVSALAFAAMTAPALADVTPQQVWDNFESYMANFGYQLEGTPSQSGDVLTVTGVAMSIEMPEEEGSVKFGMGDMILTDRGDGTVAWTYPDDTQFTLDMNIEGEQVNAVLDYDQDGYAMIVSGDPDNLRYDYSAAMLGLTLSKLVVEGEEITRDMARAKMTLKDVSGHYVSATVDGVQSMAQAMSAADLMVDAAFNDPDSDDAGTFNVALTGMSYSGDALIPEGADFSDPAAIFGAGLSGGGKMTHTGAVIDFVVTESSGATAGKVTTESGRFDVAMSEDALTYDIGNTGMTVNLQGPEIPLPIDAKMAETGFKFVVPLKPNEGPQDAALGITLAGFEMNELLWNIFDPAAVLPRDPATIAMNLTAKVTPFVSIFDEKAMMDLESTGGMPGELNALTLTDLQVKAAGGEISGTGAFTFDNSDMESFDGFPRPEGKLDLQVSGANGLIDKIIAMGLMEESDAMGARMMLSMFTVPGTAPDTASSTIEVNGQGHVLANGQRLK